MARTAGSHSDITGPRIREAALHLFARHGYNAVSMRQIAAQVGVQAGALYNYTPDKQTLLFDLMQHHMTTLLDEYAQIAATQPATQNATQPAPARLQRFVRFHIGFHITRPDEMFIAYMELRALTPENFARIEPQRRRYEDQLQSILDAGVASGAFSMPDTKIATLAVIAMLNGVNTWYRPGGRLSQEEVEALYWTMVQKAVGA